MAISCNICGCEYHSIFEVFGFPRHLTQNEVQFSYCLDSAVHFKNEVATDHTRRFESGESLMHKVTQYGMDINILKFLLENGADINAKDKDGNTPLHHLVFQISQYNYGYHSYDLVKEAIALLLSHRANYHLDNIYGSSPYEVSKINNLSEILEMFKDEENIPEIKEPE